MKVQVFLVAALLVLLVAESTSEKVRKFKKVRHGKRPTTTTTTTTTTESEVVAEVDSDDASVFNILKEDEAAQVTAEEPDAATVDDKQPAPPATDPCAKKHCGAGRVCDVNKDGEAECICIPTCPEETDPRRKVCSNHNMTWNSDCEVYQMRCWCDKEQEQCLDEKYKHAHIEYYGECRDVAECTSEELEDFPRRMRDWLFNIMRDLADRDELTPHYMRMEKEAETNLTRRWTNAAIWKWCDLDGHPHDRAVSRHELFPIRAPLMALEHCIAPFLNACDADDDHRITLAEWGACLQLDQDEMEDKCDDLREDSE